ncbi:propionyl-CoA carboxylase alpha chain/3-methylcrotonyl-CoA carboxylase alpha subunit [Caulobacter ginsengisoli]|uniref:Propionyl-CoA carboxylase alpha chain/3-methylcrotonyl-CoA carboxylase alpha subunit n=1 Tax=Caulobacter ginsengisoli TaxID=400775 RepID=A0ABU0ILD2_9CAUL|nr:biotin carboxylase N-terminal domain-containing protein [Caulobacter ginsengisoli]MDQ0462821.1 propionyl-CoA carboxylase alpha chain/3-methylcrotonyl-CoA carboxylase alpha subunit [Caulobacter ginsengisoli]
MISSLLIANRGEIARRIIRTARRMGVRTIAVYSEADAGAPHVQEADEAVLIGPSPARESYLVADKILAAAKATGAEAIHPGYGFLSENAAFARAVKAAGLIWVGPPPEAIEAMGLKDAAKSRMQAAGVPVTPGYLGENQSLTRLQSEADKTGYPVLIKAVAGGGGKGMRKVEAAADFAAALASCQREAAASFGDDKVLIEKYVTRPRHIEVQVFGDSHGNAVHLFERDCSLQRRHQKVIEEAPAPGMDAATRAAVCDAAVKAARAVNYEGAGTVEFIADASEGLRADRIWFMEMNTRLQVEHPVTEAITGQDLVEWQLRVASGEPLPLKQEDLSINGWAMEARLYAENPATGFLPSTGPLDHFQLPDFVRVDSAVEEGGEVTPFYDPMIAKLIATGETREAAAEALAEACAAVEVWPVKTNAAFLARCASHPDFVAGAIDTGFIEARLDDLIAEVAPSNRTVMTAAASFAISADEDGWRVLRGPWNDGLFNFRMNGPSLGWMPIHHAGKRLDISLEGTAYDGSAPKHSGLWVHYAGETSMAYGMAACVAFLEDDEPNPVLGVDENLKVVFQQGAALEFRRSAVLDEAGSASDGSIRSPMPGKIVSVSVKVGDKVTKGQPLLVLEAMKMEHAMTAPFDGVVAELNATPGGQVSEGVVLAKLEPSS